ncbi:DNA-3-methyladenine glycosylase [Rhynchospora pubera]|uniref:DNA-3-methyladenine glycosylase n=1 Tax=Rhynchospora pubera TaxID=906938 RepID=A0AAV8GTT8_9POAL|nr:DNA-3-methyladenine glycosylase [Rhynchospora pubera]
MSSPHPHPHPHPHTHLQLHPQHHLPPQSPTQFHFLLPMGEQTISHLVPQSTSTSTTTTNTNAAASSSPSSPSLNTSNSLVPTNRSKKRLTQNQNHSSTSSENPNPKKPRIHTITPLLRPLSTDGEVAAAIRHLRSVDPALVAVIDSHDPPNFQSFHPPFHCLVRSILYQQLAFKAAASVYSRFLSLCGGEAGVVPAAVLSLSQHQLRQIGVSPRKSSYLHDLARKYHTGILSDESIVSMDDRSLFSMLTMVKGIGAWSVHMFMIFSLHRPDVLPVGDLGVRKGVQILYGLEDVPRPSQMEQLCERWRPYRSVGAWYMWRLIENKAGSNGVVPVGSDMGAGSAPVGVSGPQFVDPIQMLPNIG